ncbi:MAG: hypothetical protein A2Y07_06270 [Planctomycetes bacterium GWF2_50_10]|nr:MAG: hypothetical protein A2Y07_06270 [Planctomycetes bacterium GWF2_50_10]
MKLISYTRNGYTSFGILKSDQIIDIPTLWPGPNNPRNLLELLWADENLEKTRDLALKADTFIPLQQVRLLAPIARPGKIIALAGNYADHIKESGRALGLSDAPRQTTTPRPFLMPSTCIIGPNDVIPWPVYSEQIDYELELAIVIGKTAKCVSPAQAINYIAGYTIANDVSARSVTYKANRAARPWDEFYDWLNGKWADGFCPIGPAIVTKDQIPDPAALNMHLTVNGKIRQQASAGQMIYSPADTVSFVSHIMTLEPGDIIATGTPKGVAMATGQWLEPGDVIECTIDAIGTLRNTLGTRPAQFYRPLET